MGVWIYDAIIDFFSALLIFFGVLVLIRLIFFGVLVLIELLLPLILMSLPFLAYLLWNKSRIHSRPHISPQTKT